ncbi:unnamed protein product [Prunus armeniaca]|uniref:Uncharacterized protein n=1 Tax=Prunus armeniaca TaxID=36596 RepID=A0A6J5TTQ4_PRUAR|nr:unnamed protein product [Prunus armeniaca]
MGSGRVSRDGRVRNWGGEDTEKERGLHSEQYSSSLVRGGEGGTEGGRAEGRRRTRRCRGGKEARGGEGEVIKWVTDVRDAVRIPRTSQRGTEGNEAGGRKARPGPGSTQKGENQGRRASNTPGRSANKANGGPHKKETETRKGRQPVIQYPVATRRGCKCQSGEGQKPMQIREQLLRWQDESSVYHKPRGPVDNHNW